MSDWQRTALNAVALVGLTAGSVFAFLGYRLYAFERELLSLPSTRGIVDESSVGDTFSSRSCYAAGARSNSSRSLELKIKYSYVVDGRSYTSTRLSNGSYRQPADFGGNIPGPQLQELAERFKAGAVVQVHYRPDQPERAYLIIDQSGSRLFISLGVAMLLAGVTAVLMRLIWRS